MSISKLELWKDRITTCKASGLRVPAKVKVKQIVQQVVKCTKCGTKDSKHPKDHFQEAAIPVAVLPHSIATPSLVAQVMYQKFAMGIPLNRQESDFHRMGLVLPWSSMSRWMIRCSDEWLLPVYNCIREELLKCAYYPYG